MKKLALFWILIFSVQILAQEKPVALKFDSYSDSNGINFNLLKVKTKQFFEAIRKSPSSTTGIIYLFSSIKEFRCFENHNSKSDIIANNILKLLKIEKDLISRISLKFAQYRTNNEVDFWIVPKNAETDFGGGIIADCFCPSFTIIDSLLDDKKTLALFVISIPASKRKLNIDWELSEGKIIKKKKGVVMVDISEVKTKEIVITLTIKGLSKGVERTCGDKWRQKISLEEVISQ